MKCVGNKKCLNQKMIESWLSQTLLRDSSVISSEDTMSKYVVGFILMLVALICSGCIQPSPEEVYDTPITLPINASPVDTLKESLRTMTDADGPRGVALFLDAFDKNRVTLSAKADEPSDFVDTIAAIIIIDLHLNTQNITPEEYTVKYSGRYFSNSGDFKITKKQIARIVQNTQNQGLLEAVIAAMAKGDFGDDMKTRGKYLTNNAYTPSNERLELYRGYVSQPRWMIIEIQ